MIDKDEQFRESDLLSLFQHFAWIINTHSVRTLGMDAFDNLSISWVRHMKRREKTSGTIKLHCHNGDPAIDLFNYRVMQSASVLNTPSKRTQII